MAVRSRVLGFSPAGVNGQWSTLLLVPAGRTAIVRRWSINNNTSGPRDLALSVRRGGVILVISNVLGVPSRGSVGEPDDNLVLNPGDELLWRPTGETGTGSTQAYAAGSLLMGEPA